MSNTKISTTLAALIIYSKESKNLVTWADIRECVLSQTHHPDLGIIDVVSIVLNAYSEAVQEPRFKMGAPDYLLRRLVLAPVQGVSSLELFPDLNSSFSVEEWYNCMLKNMISELRVSVVDWCKEEVWSESNKAYVSC